MNKLIITLMLILANISYSQIDFNPPKHSLEIDTIIEPIIEEFIHEASKRGFFVRSYLIQRVDLIVFYDNKLSCLEGGNLGITTKDYRRVYINESLADSPILLKVTVFHELGHALTKSGHHECYSCNNIMSAYFTGDITPYKDPIRWQKLLDEYYHFLNTFK